MPDQITNMCVIMLPPERNDALRSALEAHCWEFSDHQYARFKAVKEKTSVIQHSHRRPVLGAAAGIEAFQLGQDPGLLPFGGFQFQKRRSADEFLGGTVNLTHKDAPLGCFSYYSTKLKDPPVFFVDRIKAPSDEGAGKNL